MATAWVVLLVALVVAAAWFVGSGFRSVPADTVGIVFKRFGRLRPGDNPRVSVHGSAGPQARTLRPNLKYWLPRYFYQVRHVPLVQVPYGTIGVVVARAGAVPPPWRTLARYVECDHFMDGEAFLRGGGEQGRQPQILTGGSYAINTELFDVITVERPEDLARIGLSAANLQEIEIPEGETGVVITQFGATLDDDATIGERVPGHEHFQLPWVFLEGGGQKGVQRETLPAGRYAINPWFAHVVRIPTRVLLLEWSDDAKSPSRIDFTLPRIVLDVQGYQVRLTLIQTLRIPPGVAPYLVRRFGIDLSSSWSPVQQFVDKEVAATVAGFFRMVSGNYRIQEFITQYEEVRDRLAEAIRVSLQHLGVESIATTLQEFEIDQPEIAAIQRRIAVEQERVRVARARLEELETQHANELVVAEIELQRIQVERQRRELEFVELRTLVEVLGADHVVMERVVTQWITANVPESVGGQKDDIARALLQAMPFAAARDMLWTIASATSLAPAEQASATQTMVAEAGSDSERILAGSRHPRLEQASAELAATYGASVRGPVRLVQSVPDDAAPEAVEVRAVPVSIYLASEANVGAVEAALVELLDHAGIDITESKPPIVGSWFGLLVGRFRRALTSEQANEALVRVERALQARLLDLPQADIDAKQAEAVAHLVTALNNQPNACIQVGSLFLIKVDGTIIVRNLRPQEMSFLNRNHTVLSSPRDVLAALEELANRSDPSEGVNALSGGTPGAPPPSAG